MEKSKLHFYVLGALLSLGIAAVVLYTMQQNKLNKSQNLATLTVEEATAFAADAYIYAYPLVTMEMTRRVMTNVATATNHSAPMGQFANLRQYPDATDTEVTAPNADTLYSIAWVNLAKEPYILHVPNEGDRYYLMPILSAWTNVIADPGTRLGTKEETFALVGPYWQGTLPARVTEIRSPTDLVWIIGRTYSAGTPEDYKEVYAIQDQYKLTPLSQYDKPYVPPINVVDPTIDMTTPVRKQVNTMGAAEFFTLFASLLKENPPAAEDTLMVEKLAKLGIVAGQPFDFNELSPEITKGINQGLKVAQKRLLDAVKTTGKQVNGWTLFYETGTYDANYLNRAVVAAVGLGANLPQDAIYPETRVDSDGKTLNGAHQYVIHFEKNKMPPVKGFWSLTMYNNKIYFVDNPLKRYSLNSRNHFQTNADGSIDIYIQHQSPGVDKVSNWLPAPAGDFVLMFRFYWPEESIINGAWNPPSVKRVK